MEKYLVQSNSKTNSTAKRPADDHDEDWRTPKRYAQHKSPQGENTPTPNENRFQDLPVDVDATETKHCFREATTTIKKSSHIPPILLEIRKEWTHENIKNIVSTYSNRFHLLYKSGGKVAINCFTTEAHKAIKEGFYKEGISFLTYTRKDEKPRKVVIKGLPASTEKYLPAELEKLGFKPSSVTTLKSKGNSDRPCPPFLIQLPAGTDISQFKKIRYLLNCVVTIEKFTPNRTQGTQCFRCQRFGHSSHNCNMPTRCVKCTKPHATSECPKIGREEPARCCNCEGEHPANYKNCSARVAYLERLHKQKMMQQRPLPLMHPSTQRSITRPPTTSWADVVKQVHPVPTENTSIGPNPPSGHEPAPNISSDPTVLEMLEILLTIQKLKSVFKTCTSQLEKVTLILKHLGHYV